MDLALQLLDESSHGKDVDSFRHTKDMLSNALKGSVDSVLPLTTALGLSDILLKYRILSDICLIIASPCIAHKSTYYSPKSSFRREELIT